jgi:hypothetical protein
MQTILRFLSKHKIVFFIVGRAIENQFIIKSPLRKPARYKYITIITITAFF